MIKYLATSLNYADYSVMLPSRAIRQHSKYKVQPDKEIKYESCLFTKTFIISQIRVAVLLLKLLSINQLDNDAYSNDLDLV